MRTPKHHQPKLFTLYHVGIYLFFWGLLLLGEKMRFRRHPPAGPAKFGETKVLSFQLPDLGSWRRVFGHGPPATWRGSWDPITEGTMDGDRWVRCPKDRV